MSLSESEKLFFKAISAFNTGDVVTAADLFSELTERFPDSGKAHGYLGLLFFQHFKNPVAAEDHFKKAISSSPEFTESYLCYAELLLSQERYAEMNAHLNKVSEIPGVKKNVAYELYGKMSELMGKYEEAIDHYKKAIVFTFSDEDMLSYQKAIARCNEKKKYV